MATAKTTDATLRELLDGLTQILSYAGLYGGNEIAKARDLQRRIKQLLSPEPTEPLAAEAAAFVANFLPAIAARKQQARIHEAAQEKASADHKARYAAHRAKQAVPLEAERKRIEEMVKRNVQAAVTK